MIFLFNYYNRLYIIGRLIKFCHFYRSARVNNPMSSVDSVGWKLFILVPVEQKSIIWFHVKYFRLFMYFAVHFLKIKFRKFFIRLITEMELYRFKLAFFTTWMSANNIKEKQIVISFRSESKANNWCTSEP